MHKKSAKWGYILVTLHKCLQSQWDRVLTNRFFYWNQITKCVLLNGCKGEIVYFATKMCVHRSLGTTQGSKQALRFSQRDINMWHGPAVTQSICGWLAWDKWCTSFTLGCITFSCVTVRAFLSTDYFAHLVDKQACCEVVNSHFNPLFEVNCTQQIVLKIKGKIIGCGCSLAL